MTFGTDSAHPEGPAATLPTPAARRAGALRGVLGALLLALVASACVDGTGGAGPAPNPVLPLSEVEFASEFGVDTLDFVRGNDVLVRTDVVGDTTAPAVAAGDLVRLHYQGWTAGGVLFDAHTPESGDPVLFRLGAPGTLPGLTRGLVGMREGGERTVLVAPPAGFGSTALPGIPPNSWLVLRLQLVERVEASDDS